MTSTQRSKSQNRVLKDGYVGSVTTLHMFAKRVLDSIQHTDHMEAGESHYSQVFYTFSKCKPGSFVCVLASAKEKVCLIASVSLQKQWLYLLATWHVCDCNLVPLWFATWHVCVCV
jgi:hypothetical protein